MGEYLIPAIATVVVAIIEVAAASERKKSKQQIEKDELATKRRAEESRLSMQMMHATLQLSVVCSNALTNGHNNGNVERARKAAEKADQEYEAFLQKVASEHLGGI